MFHAVNIIPYSLCQIQCFSVQIIELKRFIDTFFGIIETAGNDVKGRKHVPERHRFPAFHIRRKHQCCIKRIAEDHERSSRIGKDLLGLQLLM